MQKLISRGVATALFTAFALAMGTPQSASASDVLQPGLHSVPEFTADWHIGGRHDHTSQAERTQAGLEALKREAQRRVDILNATLGNRFSVESVKFVRHISGGSKTKKNPVTGKRSHEAWGKVAGQMVMRTR